MEHRVYQQTQNWQLLVHTQTVLFFIPFVGVLKSEYYIKSAQSLIIIIIIIITEFI